MFKWMKTPDWHGDRFIYFISDLVGSWKLFPEGEQLRNVQAGVL